MADAPTLHHVPPSYYSQVARLVLVEKGVEFRGQLVAAGPPLFESYAPTYMRLNPGGTVPTLVDGERVVPDSRAILEYVDANFEGPPLTPEDPDERARMDELIAAMYDISIRELSYGSIGKLGTRMNGLRAANLRKRAAANPDMREVYEAKLRDIEGFSQGAQDRAHVDAIRAELGERLDRLDAELEQREFMAGRSYSLADVAWTVCVARLRALGLEPLAGREHLREWYERMKARPSFAAADVWERMKPRRILALVLTKLWPQILAVLALIGLVIYALWWLLS